MPENEQASHPEPASQLGPTGSSLEDPQDSKLLPTVIDNTGADIVQQERRLWTDLAVAKQKRLSPATKEELGTSYRVLAEHYARYGGYQYAAQLIKNALEQVETDELRHALARMQAKAGSYEFVIHFQRLIKQRSYNLKLALEFCYFLENARLHDAALKVLDDELKKRGKVHEPNTESENVVVNQFLDLIRARGGSELQDIVSDYIAYFTSNLPVEVTTSNVNQQVSRNRVSLSWAEIGPQLEETESQHGIKEELFIWFEYAFFFSRTYPVALIVGSSVIVLLLLGLARVGVQTIEAIGNGLAIVFISFLFFEFMRSFRLPAELRSRAQKSVAQSSLFGSFALILLTWLGPKMLRSDGHFVSVITIKSLSAILVAALLWRAYLSATNIKQFFVEAGSEIVRLLVKRAFRRQIAGIVAGSTKWSSILGVSLLIGILSRGTPLLACLAGLQITFLLCCWRWGYLEVQAEKLALRDFLALMIGITYVGVVVAETLSAESIFEVVVFTSFDSIVVLGVSVVYMLQISQLGKSSITIISIVSLFLNFVPVVGERNLSYLSGLLLELGRLKEIGALAQVATLICLVFCVKLVRKSSKAEPTYHHVEMVMGSKYNVSGNIGAVGDNSQASNFTQMWTTSSKDIDLVALARELSVAREQLQPQAREPEHFMSLSEITEAEKAALAGDGPKALEKLKVAGAWFWDALQRVGVGVATAAAKRALGF